MSFFVDVACMLNHAIILTHSGQAHAKIQFQKVMEVEGDKQISVLEGAVYYVDPKSAGSLGFLGGKERVRIPLTEEHSSLEALKKTYTRPCGPEDRGRETWSRFFNRS